GVWERVFPLLEAGDMGGDEERWQRFIQGLRDGDSRIVTEFCGEYGGLMHELAERHLAPGLRRRVGPEDVVQSACRTLLRRAKNGEFQLADSAGLWRLLCAITLTKIREQARFHLRKKRGLDQELHTTALPGDSTAGDFHLVDPTPQPDQAA